MVNVTAESVDLSANQQEERAHRIGLPSLCALPCGLGIVTGLGAVLFRDLIGFIHNLMFLGVPSAQYDANLFTPQARGECSSSSCR